MAFSNGIAVLAVLAIVLIIVFDADVSKLIQLYILGVFLSFTLSQLGMIRHWTRRLKEGIAPSDRSMMLRSRAINSVGFVLCAIVLMIVLLTKFTRGAWIICVAIPVLYLLMMAIHRHYASVREELAAVDADDALPPRVHGVILVSKVHQPTLRAIAYARASRPSTLEAITVDVDHDETAALIDQWQAYGIPVPLRILDSPFREVTRPIVDHVR